MRERRPAGWGGNGFKEGPARTPTRSRRSHSPSAQRQDSSSAPEEPEQETPLPSKPPLYVGRGADRTGPTCTSSQLLPRPAPPGDTCSRPPVPAAPVPGRGGEGRGGHGGSVRQKSSTMCSGGALSPAATADPPRGEVQGAPTCFARAPSKPDCGLTGPTGTRPRSSPALPPRCAVQRPGCRSTSWGGGDSTA